MEQKIKDIVHDGVKLDHRTLFVVTGDKSKEMVMLLTHFLTEVKTNPSILWCHEKDLPYHNGLKKRIRQLQRKIQSGKFSPEGEDPFDLFLCSTRIRFCYYSETQKILGNTYGVCVLQNFEALTPNLLARTIETVEGGGLIIILLPPMDSLKQVYTMNMNVHQKFKTEAHNKVACRFNERFVLSLASCKRCLVVNDKCEVLPLSYHNLQREFASSSRDVSATQNQLSTLIDAVREYQPAGKLISCCKTLDQARAVSKFIETFRAEDESTVSLTASRGRGKSAALGLAVAGAVSSGYSNIFVTSPSPENLNTFFDFVFKGFDALNYEEHAHYTIVRSTNPEFNEAVVRVNIRRSHRQTIQYIQPHESEKLCQADLLVIDEAAAIPLPYVKSLMGPYSVFLASTINGYEGTGRSLSLKLIQQLRNQETFAKDNKSGANPSIVPRRPLVELALDEPIRYKFGDDVENWLTRLLCLNATSAAAILSSCSPPGDCDLYYVNRDALFSYHSASEIFLERLVALYVSSHYKNTPNDLQMMSDAPAHHLFCLLSPLDPDGRTLPEILAVIQVCLEGEISGNSVAEGFSRGKKAAGDLIPWTVGQQFHDCNFPQLSGARIVRIATHPDLQGKGYGTRALNILKEYYEGKIAPSEDACEEEVADVPDKHVGLFNEEIRPRKNVPPLLKKLSERPPEKLDYLGVGFGLTEQLLKFWKRAGYVPVYLRQTTNDLTGENSCIMLNVLNCGDDTQDYLSAYWADFRRRFINLLSFAFRKFSVKFALSVLTNKARKIKANDLSKLELDMYFIDHDIKRLESYSNNLIDNHMIADLIPKLARLYFENRMGSLQMSAVQSAILIGVGLQNKRIDCLAAELDLPSSQLMGLLNQIVVKYSKYLNSVAGKGGCNESGKKRRRENNVKEPREEFTLKRKKNKKSC